MSATLRGRPSRYSQDVADEICERLAAGEGLREICRTPGMPNEATVRQWVLHNVNGFYTQYAMSREVQMHSFADQIIEISDDSRNDWMLRNDPENPGWIANGEHINRTRLRIDARKWLTSKVLPKFYGDRLQQDVNVTGSIDVQALKNESKEELLERLRKLEAEMGCSGKVIEGRVIEDQSE